MKSYTDLEQSKALAEILPLESADMSWCNNPIRRINNTDSFYANIHTVKEMREAFDEALCGWDNYWELIPCWSLAVLLDVLQDFTLHKYVYYKEDMFLTKYLLKNDKPEFFLKMYDNPVDACYELILKLHELKML